MVYSINPKQLDRYRDRFSLAGAKDDRLDARVLAENRAIGPQSPATSGCTDARSGDATRLLASPWTVDCRQAASDQPDRDILWRYYPQFLEIYSDLSRLWVLELWMLAPTPHKARRLRLSSIERLLKKHRIRCIDAKTVKQCLTAPSVAVAAATTQGAVFQLKSVIERLTLVIQQLKETHREWIG